MKKHVRCITPLIIHDHDGTVISNGEIIMWFDPSFEPQVGDELILNYKTPAAHDRKTTIRIVKRTVTCVAPPHLNMDNGVPHDIAVWCSLGLFLDCEPATKKSMTGINACLVYHRTLEKEMPRH